MTFAAQAFRYILYCNIAPKTMPKGGSILKPLAPKTMPKGGSILKPLAPKSRHPIFRRTSLPSYGFVPQLPGTPERTTPPAKRAQVRVACATCHMKRAKASRLTIVSIRSFGSNAQTSAMAVDLRVRAAGREASCANMTSNLILRVTHLCSRGTRFS
jgi:hypothetical protein